MRFCKLFRYALTTGAAGAFLAACGTLRQSQSDMPPMNAQAAMPRTSTVAAARLGAGSIRLSKSYQVLYRFNLKNGVGSGQPMGGLAGSGPLYGTTQLGGRLNRGGCCGTVYSITTTGTYNTLYAFRGHSKGDGASPRAGLVGGYGGTLYGTTYSGGSSNLGTVYSVSTAGAEKVLHSFAGGTDGAHPTSQLFYFNGIWYGTTTQGGGSGCGGSSGCGTVYTITASGQENVFYAFKGGSDGATPSSALIVYTDDALPPKTRPRAMYGTTSFGGGTGCGGLGCGTVYSITTSGQEKVLYSFAGRADGWEPEGLDDNRGELFGTTVAGGTGCRGAVGCGTVYTISTGGYKRTAYNFRGGSDGACPSGPLIDILGTVYGTTTCGGGCSKEPCGTVYSFTGGTEQVLYRFTNSADGFNPDAPLINMGHTLYGTTLEGGGSGKGYGHGVFFALDR